MNHQVNYPKDRVGALLLTEMLTPKNLGVKNSKNLRCGCIEADREWLLCAYHAGMQHGIELTSKNGDAP